VAGEFGDHRMRQLGERERRPQLLVPHWSGKYSILRRHSSRDVARAISPRSSTIWPIVARGAGWERIGLMTH